MDAAARPARRRMTLLLADSTIFTTLFGGERAEPGALLEQKHRDEVTATRASAWRTKEHDAHVEYQTMIKDLVRGVPVLGRVGDLGGGLRRPGLGVPFRRPKSGA